MERIQDISEEDAKAEGIEPDLVDTGAQDPSGHWIEVPDYFGPFMELWDSINGRRGFGWDANSWCWCITFKRIEEQSRDGDVAFNNAKW